MLRPTISRHHPFSLRKNFFFDLSVAKNVLEERSELSQLKPENLDIYAVIGMKYHHIKVIFSANKQKSKKMIFAFYFLLILSRHRLML